MKTSDPGVRVFASRDGWDEIGASTSCAVDRLVNGV